MTLNLIDLLREFAGLAAGGFIGYAFGVLQQTAQRRHAEQERSGKLKSGWSLIPGAGARVAYLLIALALIQFLCPLFFTDGTQWFVSVGVGLGYGWALFRQLRERLKSTVN